MIQIDPQIEHLYNLPFVSNLIQKGFLPMKLVTYKEYFDMYNDLIEDEYTSGQAVRKICEKFNVTRKAVYQALREMKCIDC